MGYTRLTTINHDECVMLSMADAGHGDDGGAAGAGNQLFGVAVQAVEHKMQRQLHDPQARSHLHRTCLSCRCTAVISDGDVRVNSLELCMCQRGGHHNSYSHHCLRNWMSRAPYLHSD